MNKLQHAIERFVDDFSRTFPYAAQVVNRDAILHVATRSFRELDDAREGRVKKMLRAAKRAVSNPDAPGPEQAVVDLLLDFRDRTVEPESSAPWIFRATLDVDRYAGAILALLDEARATAYHEGVAAGSETPPPCACRCRAHQKVACPKCLRVHSCPAHHFASSEALEVELLQDPIRTAEALYREARDLTGQGTPWGELDDVARDAHIEATRRIVATRTAVLLDRRAR